MCVSCYIGIFHAITNATPQEINRYHREYYDCFALPCDSCSYLPNKRTRNLRDRYKSIPNELIEYKVIFSNLLNLLKTPHICVPLYRPNYNDEEDRSSYDTGHSNDRDSHSSDSSDNDSSSHSSNDSGSSDTESKSESKAINNENLNIIFTQLINSITGIRELTSSISESNSHTSSPYVISKGDIELHCLLANATTLPEYTLYHHTTPLITSVCKGIEASTYAALPQCLQVCSDSAIELLRYGYKYDDCVIPAIVITGIYVEILCVYLLADNFPVIISLSRLLLMNTYEGICALSKWVIALKHFAIETVSLHPQQQSQHHQQQEPTLVHSRHTWQSTPEEQVYDNHPSNTPPSKHTTNSIETLPIQSLPHQPQCAPTAPLIAPYSYTYISLDFSQYFFKPLKLVADSGDNNRYQIEAKNDVSNLIYKRNLYMYIYQKLSEIKYAHDVILFPVGVMSLPSSDNPYCGTNISSILTASNNIHTSSNNNTSQSSSYVADYTHTTQQDNNTSSLYTKLESHINQYFPLLEVSMMTHTPILIYPLLLCTPPPTTTTTTAAAAAVPTTSTWSSSKPSKAYRADYIRKVTLAVSILNEAGVAHMVRCVAYCIHTFLLLSV